MTTAAPSWPCEICLRPSVPRVHPGCQERLADNLNALPGLYRKLADVLTPGQRGGWGRTGTRTAPLPVNVDVLDLRGWGGIEGLLTSWERDVRETLGWEPVSECGTVEATVDQAAGFLALQLPWICEEHPAVREFAEEVGAVTAHARRLVTGEKPPRRIPVRCACGQVLRITLDTPGYRCPDCNVQYERDELMSLPLAERSSAA